MDAPTLPPTGPAGDNLGKGEEPEGPVGLEESLFEGKDPADLDGEGEPLAADEGRRLLEGVEEWEELERVVGRELRAEGNLGVLLGDCGDKFSFPGTLGGKIKIT